MNKTGKKVNLAAIMERLAAAVGGAIEHQERAGVALRQVQEVMSKIAAKIRQGAEQSPDKKS